jgi:hypothetical protein
MEQAEAGAPPASSPVKPPATGRRKWVIAGVVAALVAAALIIGLAVGLQSGGSSSSSSEGDEGGSGNITPSSGASRKLIWSDEFAGQTLNTGEVRSGVCSCSHQQSERQ